MKNKIKELLKAFPKDVIFNDSFVYDYFKQHPNWNEKIKSGFIGFAIKKNEWNYSFHVANSEINFTPISYNYDIKESYDDQLKKALRNEIQVYVDKVRNNVNFGIDKCVITGEILTKKNTHIDHYNLDFKDLVKKFTSQYDNIQIHKKGVKFYLKDDVIKQEWVKYHNENTNLRAVTATANLARNRKNKLRDYQIDISDKAAEKLRKLRIVYICMEVRTGKTLTALETAKKIGAVNVLFLTKKKAIGSILDDYAKFQYQFQLTVVNDESMHKETGKYDLVIHDEHHRFGSFPKPSKGAKLFREKYGHLPMIFLSGTPHPESYSQIYHQFWVSDYTPFRKWTNFYKWSRDFVNVTERNFGYGNIKDYSEANINLINEYIRDYLITFTQKDAGFTSEINEHILQCKMKPLTYQLCDRLKKDLVIEGKDQILIADTAVKLMQKLHQMYSGTIKFEDGTFKVIDHSKAKFIRDYFQGKKIGIFYKFIAEYKALKDVFGDMLTNDLDEFNNTDKHIALQIVSGREGISLKNADYLVYYNIDFSATSYWQSRDRLTTMDRLSNDVYWVFSDGGIEGKIYKAVTKKKSFTSSVFKQEYGIKFPKKDNNQTEI